MMELLSLPFRTNFLLYYEKFFIISDGLRWLSSNISYRDALQVSFWITRVNQEFLVILIRIK